MHTIGSWAALLGAGPDRKAVGIELNSSYVKAAISGTVTAVCTPVRRGRTLATFLIRVTDDRDQLTASGRLTCLIVPALRPRSPAGSRIEKGWVSARRRATTAGRRGVGGMSQQR